MLRPILKLTWLLLLLVGTSILATAVAPMRSPIALVAGQGTPGFTDGDFSRATFNGLSGLLLDDTHNLLYVAESGNASIRTVDLNHENRVSTLLGRRGPGSRDGVLAESQIRAPAHMIWTDKSKTMLFSDAGNHQIKRLDLVAGTCVTVCGNTSPGLTDRVGNQARFREPQGLLRLSPSRILVADTGNGALRLVTLTNGETQTLFLSPSTQKYEFQFAFFDTDLNLILTCRNKPGLWRLLNSDQTPLTLPQINAFTPTPEVGLALTPELLHPLDHEITAYAMDGIHLYYNLKAPEGERTTCPLRYVNIYTPKVSSPMDYQNWLPPSEVYTAGDGGVTKTAHPLQAYRLYDSAQGLAYAPQQETVYIADDFNHRIISLRVHRRGEFFRGSYCPPQKPAGVKRILLFGNSLNYVISERRPLGISANEEMADSLSRRLEYWLNALALAQGRATRYEVIYAGGAMFYSAPSVAYAFFNLFAVNKLQIDLVLYNYTYFDFIFDAVRYIQTPYANGELQHHDFDLEFFLTPIEKRALHPLGKELLKYIIKHPQKMEKLAKYTPGVRDLTFHENTTTDVLYDPEVQDLFFRLATDELSQYQLRLKSLAPKDTPPVPFVINLIPLPINLYNNEILTDFRQGAKTKPDFLAARLKPWCLEKGIGFQDTIDPIRIMAPSLFPMNVAKDYHYTERSADAVAFFTASQLLDKIK